MTNYDIIDAKEVKDLKSGDKDYQEQLKAVKIIVEEYFF